MIDKASGKRVLDLKSEDNGTGAYKEGDVEWAPDSKGFLFIAKSANDKPAAKLYLLSGKSFTKIALPPDSGPPPDDRDPQIAEAVYDGVGQETLHWSKPNTLVCDRTYYFRKMLAPDSPFYVERKFEITMTIAPDGKVTTEKKKIGPP